MPVFDPRDWRNTQVPTAQDLIDLEQRLATFSIACTPNAYQASSEAQMLASAATQGDFVVRNDLPATFLLRVEPATILSNWTRLPGEPTTLIDGGTP